MVSDEQLVSRVGALAESITGIRRDADAIAVRLTGASVTAKRATMRLERVIDRLVAASPRAA